MEGMQFDGPSPAPNPNPTPPTDAREAEMAEMRGQMEALTTSVGQIGGMFETMLGHVNQPARQADPQPTGPQWPDDETFEQMPRKEAFGVLTKNIMGELENKFLTPLKAQIDGLSRTVQTQNGQSLLTQAQAKYADLGQWEQELAEVLQTQKVPNIDRAMVIVKAENPDKARKLAAQAQQPSTPNEEEELMTYAPQRPGQAAGSPTFGNLSLTDATLAAFNKHGKPIIQAQQDAENQSLMSMPQ